MKKTIIFDWSGTLINNFDCFCKIYEMIRKELGGKILSKEDIRQTFTIPYMKFWNKHFPNLTKEHQDKLFGKFVHQVNEAKLYSNAKKTLEALKEKGHDLFIVSSDPIGTLSSQIKKFELEQFFTEIFGEIYNKSDCLKMLIEKYNLDKENVFYIGDTSGDVEAGKESRIKTVGISWGFQCKEELLKSDPDYLIDEITEIKKIGIF